jgi:hypothetical protein
MFSKLKIAIAVITVLANVLCAEQFSGKKGDFWTGGAFNFISLGSGGR